ncbi:hypothetical protein [Deinococcus radiotolerans]|uniref:Uncharacterized protein n=1 Tax=Deinococcus radiotolerans TaxID=1309407 RepID=A0ABQ2FRS4_9DEIO|nr:hypothetical protein [Deinococcus radiotolerans]GGL20553.1 hypothetical protein GCM10010844_44250 [Deinococcus radiotolerans]
MRNITKLAVAAALAFSGMAFAVDSTSTTENSATMTVQADGTTLDTVKFSVGSGSITIPADNMRSGAEFDIKIPVTNNTNRAITVTSDLTVDTLLDTALFTITSTNADTGIALTADDGQDYIVYHVTFANLDTDAKRVAFSKQTLTLSFELTGTADAPANVAPVVSF